MKWTQWDDGRAFDAGAVARWQRVLFVAWVAGIVLAAYCVGR